MHFLMRSLVIQMTYLILIKKKNIYIYNVRRCIMPNNNTSYLTPNWVVNPFRELQLELKNAFSEIEADKVIVYNNYLLRLII